MERYEADIRERIKMALVQAGTCFSCDKKAAYQQAVEAESNQQARWVLETILENAEIAEKTSFPLCDDTGIPHVLVEIGKERSVSGKVLEAIHLGIADGLGALPGRPMALTGDDIQRLEQSGGLAEDPAALVPAPVLLKMTEGSQLRIHVLLLGGGPAIRAKTYRLFHKHDIAVVKEEIIDWAIEAASQLGCTPCTLAIGIGRSHYEAAAYMLEAQAYGSYDQQSELEREITSRVNNSKVGALGLHGDTTVLGTFLKVGPQRASGVRIVSLRPCCCFEPRKATVML